MFDPFDYEEYECGNCGETLKPEDLQYDFENDLYNCPYCGSHMIKVKEEERNGI